MKGDKQEYWNLTLALDYLEDKLDSVKTEELNQLMEEDEGFSDWMHGIYKEWIKDPVGYRAEMEKFSQAFFSGLRKFSDGKKSNKTPWLAIGMAASLLILLAVYLWFSPSKICEIKDYECWIDQNEGLYLERITSAGGGLPSDLVDLAAAYKDSSFQEVIQLAPKVLAQEITEFQRNEIKLYQGISYLFLDQYSTAINSLRDLANQPEPYYSQSLWYISLSQLAAGHNEAAKESLRPLSTFPNVFQVAAKSLLEQIP